jgi:hypothetical protein
MGESMLIPRNSQHPWAAARDVALPCHPDEAASLGGPGV